MRELKGKTIAVGVDGQTIKGKLVADFQDRIVVVSSDGSGKSNVANIMKSKMSFFVVQEEKSEAEIERLAEYSSGVPLSVLGCSNKDIKCEGVRFIAKKFENDIKKEDFDTFMAQCPARNKTCRCGVAGNVMKMSGDALCNMLSGLLLGEYPDTNQKP